MKHFTIHARLTHNCNADCSYCSSWKNNSDKPMKIGDFEQSMHFIVNKILPFIGVNKDVHISMQFIGGEILTLNHKDLLKYITAGRNIISSRYPNYIDGCQSNLIASDRKIIELFNLFGNNISTSIDSYGSCRTVNGDSLKYKKILDNSLSTLLSKRNFKPSAVYVMDNNGCKNIISEFILAEKSSRALTLRPAFNGGKTVSKADEITLISLYKQLFDIWFMKSNIRLYPHQQFVESIINSRQSGGCPFQNNCAESSLSLEPNGNLHICMDMADSNVGLIGNALTGELDINTWNKYALRKNKLDSSCFSCRNYSVCQGGCMNDAISSGGSIYDKTELCSLWLNLIDHIKFKIDNEDNKNIIAWLDTLE